MSSNRAVPLSANTDQLPVSTKSGNSSKYGQQKYQLETKCPEDSWHTNTYKMPISVQPNIVNDTCKEWRRAPPTHSELAAPDKNGWLGSLLCFENTISCSSQFGSTSLIPRSCQSYCVKAVSDKGSKVEDRTKFWGWAGSRVQAGIQGPKDFQYAYVWANPFLKTEGCVSGMFKLSIYFIFHPTCPSNPGKVNYLNI